MIGTQSYNDALADQLLAQGVIHTGQERAMVIGSLDQLTVTPGGAVTSRSSGGSSGTSGGTGGNPPDHTLTMRYVCKQVDLCIRLLPVALDVFRSNYADLKAQAAATARAVYEPQLRAAQAQLASATDAYQRYEASLPAKSSKSPTQSSHVDVTQQALLHDIDQAQHAVDVAQTQLQNIDNITLVANALLSNIYVIDGPKMGDAMLGIPGFGKGNLKVDGIIWATCIAAAAAYLILVGFLDRTVREPDEIKNRLGKSVVTIPAYQSPPPKGKAAT
jgi:hypothetical protein